jgi:methionyl-tRNA formyltransferase
MSVEKKLRVVFFGEVGSTFSSLHYAALKGQAEVVLWVASKAERDKRRPRREAFRSVSDWLTRLRTRAAIELQTLWHFGKPLSLLIKQECAVHYTSRNDKDLTRILRELKPDMIISAGFSRILPAEVLEIPEQGAFNCHPSLLPEFAGSNPWFWILRHGASETAVTVHRMAPEVDSGNIVSQKRFTLSPQTSHQQLLNRASLLNALLLREWLSAWRQGERREFRQDLSRRSFFPAPREEDYRIDWSWKASEIENLVRASSPSGAWTTLRGSRFSVLRVDRVNGNGHAPGTITRVGKRGVEVCCADATIRVTSAATQVKAVKGARLSSALGVAVGDRLG